MLQVLENFMGYSNQKAEKKILSRSKKKKKKKISDNPSLRYIF